MTERLSEEKQAKILELYFSGYSMDGISSMTGNTGKGTIQGLVNTIYKEYGKESIKDIINTIKAFKKAKISAGDVIASARICSIVKKMGLDDDVLFELASKIYKGSQEYKLDPSKLVEFASLLFELQPKLDIPLDDIPSHIQNLQLDKEKLENEIASLVRDAQDAREKKEAEIQKLGLVQNTLDDYTKTRKSLEGFGAKMEDLVKLENLLHQASSLGYNTKDLVSYASREQDFEARIDKLQKDNNMLQSQISEKEQRLQTLLKDEQVYKSKIEALKTTYAHISDSVSSVQEISKKGIDSLRIVQWEEILKSCGMTSYRFEEQIKEYGKLETIILGLKKSVDNFKKEEVSLQSKITQLSKEKQIVESSLIQTRDLTLKMLDDFKKQIIGTASDMESQTKESILSAKEESVKRINEAADAASSKLKGTADSFEKMITDLSICSQEFGRMTSLTPLYYLVTETKGELERVLLSVHLLLRQLLLWLDKNPKQLSLKPYAQNLKMQIEKVIVER